MYNSYLSARLGVSQHLVERGKRRIEFPQDEQIALQFFFSRFRRLLLGLLVVLSIYLVILDAILVIIY